MHDKLDRASSEEFKRVTWIRGALPNDEYVIVLMGRMAMDKTSYNRILPGIQTDTTLFPNRDKKIFCYA